MTSPTSIGSGPPWPAATPWSTWPPRSGSASDSTTSTTTSGRTTSAPPSCCGRPPNAGVARVVYASSMVVYGEGAYSCPLTTDRSTPPPRRVDRPADGRFEPLVPALRLRPRPRPGPRGRAVGPPQRLRGDQGAREHLAATWSRETGRERGRAPVPQRLRPGHAARHPVRRGRLALPAPSTAASRPRSSRTARQRRNFVHVDDVAAAVVAAAGADLPPGVTPLNVGSPRRHHDRGDGRGAQPRRSAGPTRW